MSTSKPVLIVGAGLSGLTCATYLHRQGVPYRLLEQADGVGGRVRTDSVDGFRLDRGFQVLLTAYPEARRLLDYETLNLHSFDAGALIRKGGRFHHVSDPLRHPGRSLATLKADVGSLSDKMRILKLRRDSKEANTHDGSHRLTGQTTKDALSESWGFSPGMIDAFFRPFIGGITLDASLLTDRAFLEFVMHMFSEGSAAFPAGGMQAIPDQLAAGLNPEWIQLETPIASTEQRAVVCHDGSRIEGSGVVVASDMDECRRLSGHGPDRAWNGTICMYFDVPQAPEQRPLLMLNGSGKGLINNVVAPSTVAPGYAPEGRHLVAVSVFSNHVAIDLESAVETELEDWFGASATSWRHLRTYHIPHSLPSQAAGSRKMAPKSAAFSETGLILCGDHLTTSSINGAMASGRLAAEMAMASILPS